MKNPVLVWSFKACLLGSPLLMHRYLLIQHDEYFITKDDTKQKSIENRSAVGSETPTQ